ncbi:MAG: hypothetical protein BWY69_00680 [Planctomycetes bacterium ADurb.Bin401]|nr:MAG: hypothetical protein BWY69_00680 [Planctomycetes bacterium ADurb.Bin401]
MRGNGINVGRSPRQTNQYRIFVSLYVQLFESVLDSGRALMIINIVEHVHPFAYFGLEKFLILFIHKSKCFLPKATNEEHK